MLKISILIHSKIPHIFISFPQDFALSGMRVGVIYSWNSTVITAIEPLMYFGAVPAVVQNALCNMISDKGSYMYLSN